MPAGAVAGGTGAAPSSDVASSEEHQLLETESERLTDE